MNSTRTATIEAAINFIASDYMNSQAQEVVEALENQKSGAVEAAIEFIAGGYMNSRAQEIVSRLKSL